MLVVVLITFLSIMFQVTMMMAADSEMVRWRRRLARKLEKVISKVIPIVSFLAGYSLLHAPKPNCIHKSSRLLLRVKGTKVPGL